MRSLRLLALIGLVLLAGCAAPTGSAAPPDDVSNGSDGQPDVQGWENGYWHNASLSVDPDDGLNESELDAVVARSMARVEVVRDIEFEEDVNVTVVSRAEYRRNAPGSAPEDADRTFENVKHRALFLVGDGADAADLSQRNAESAVLGYYDVREDRIVLVSDAETPRVDEITLAQELYHAYQFRYGNDVEIRAPLAATDDTVAAVLSLVEGDANLVDDRYDRRCEAEWDCLRPRDDDAGAATNATPPDVHMGLYLLEYFPYAEGQSYVESVREREGWDGVTAQYETPPVSTEQVIHGRHVEGPRPLDLPDRSAAEWRRVGRSGGGESATLGERGLATMFAYTLYDDRNGSLVEPSAFVQRSGDNVSLDYDLEYSNGWGNDLLYAYENGDDTGYVWRIRWDDEASARTFVEGYERLLRYHGATSEGRHWVVEDGPFADAYYVERVDDAVTIVSAPSAGEIAELYPRAGDAVRDDGT
ncbi:hypothetical protein G9464_04345 [Halostella sp. JP-L12]|uniref:Hvo_1808 family surface protein n=1 Tax=Halostella TaxID=1843185 RepID=UPI000EF822AF|nr:MULTISPECIES: Hvo_1808 family surface protein [Halostella]NHN46825.1 hypothetical protein [Halostella sp. JP-L12]